MNVSREENLQFMIERYSFTAEELSGIDLNLFIKDYRLRTIAYTAQDVHDILEAHREQYQETSERSLLSKIYAILNEKGEQIPSPCELNRIGYYYNSGSYAQREVFDLVQKVYYLNDTMSHPLNEEQVISLQELPEKCGISKWESHTSGPEEPTTGHFVWKLVFELKDGTFCVYDGHTQDMSHLPEHFSEVTQVFKSIVQEAG